MPWYIEWSGGGKLPRLSQHGGTKHAHNACRYHVCVTLFWTLHTKSHVRVGHAGSALIVRRLVPKRQDQEILKRNALLTCRRTDTRTSASKLSAKFVVISWSTGQAFMTRRLFVQTSLCKLWISKSETSMAHLYAVVMWFKICRREFPCHTPVCTNIQTFLAL
jgi:hypothetical protein